MSALSNCVTCGIAFQAWLRCSAVLRRMPVIGLRSTSPHLREIRQRRADRRSAAPRRWPPRPGRCCRCCSSRAWQNSLTSSCVMRPPGPVPGTCVTSTPISRASRRTDGAAGAAVTCDAARRRRAGAAAGRGTRRRDLVTEARGLSGASRDRRARVPRVRSGAGAACLRCLRCQACCRLLPVVQVLDFSLGTLASHSALAPDARLGTAGTHCAVLKRQAPLDRV